MPAAAGAAPERPQVLVFVFYYPSAERPSQGAFVREYARAAARHAEVVVLCNDGGTREHPRGHALSDRVEDGIRTVRLSYRKPPAPLPHLQHRLGIRAALKRLAADGFRPDVVHAHYYLAGGMALRIARRRGVAALVSEHSSTFPAGTLGAFRLWRARRALGRAALVCPVSAHLERAIRAAGIEARFRIVPNTVDTDVFHPPADRARRVAGDPIRLAFVAVIRPGKGLDELLRALARIDAPAWRLEVAGEGPARGDAERLAAELGLAHRVRFLGELPKVEVAELLRRSDLFVLPSHAETQGVVLIEAMASGLPVLATDVGGVPETVEPGSGVLVPPRDPEALEAGLRSLLQDPGRFDRAEIASQARDRFGYAAIGGILDDIYRDLIARGA